MNFIYENQGHITYLSYEISPEDIIDTLSLGMITNNKIPGLAPSIFTQMDTTKFIKYNVSAKISVEQFFSGAVTKKHLLGVFKGIVAAVLASEDYMIDINSIVFDLEHIFADVSTCEVSLICLPIQKGAIESVNLNAFFKNIMFSTQFDQSENCDYVAKIINYLNASPVFSLEDFKALLDTLDNNSAQSTAANVIEPKKEVPPQSVVAQPAQAVQQPVAQTAIVQPTVRQMQPPVVNTPDVVVPPTVSKQTTPPNVIAQKKTEETSEKKKGGLFGGLFSSNEKKASKEEKKVPAVPNMGTKPAGNGFAIPGQPAPAPAPAVNKGFAIPGQPAPAPAPAVNKGFAIPRQPAPAPAPAVNKDFAIPGQPAPAPAPAMNKGFAIPGQKVPVNAQPEVKEQPAQKVEAVAPVVTATPAVQSGNTPSVIPPSQPMNFGETTVLGGGSIGETTVLGATTAVAPQENPHLIRAKNNEKINLNKPVFRIGKEKSYVDYFIGDNTAISRSHANFISRDGEYFVTDTNSTNHTYVNGVMIQSNVEMKLTHGDKVRLANEDFEFNLY